MKRRGRGMWRLVPLAAMALGPAGASGAAQAGPLPRPKRVLVQVAGRSLYTVEAVAWDAKAVHTADRKKIEWSSLPAPDAWHLCAQLVDVNSAEDWLNMARMLRPLPDSTPWARRAAQWSTWLSMQTLVDSGKLLQSLGGVPQDLSGGDAPITAPAVDEGDDDHGEHTTLKPSDPWPAMNEDEQVAAERQLRAEMRILGESLGVQWSIGAAPTFLFYSDGPAFDAAPLAAEAGRTYSKLLEMFGLPRETNLFWGKCVIVHCSTYERFTEVQRKAFNSSSVPHMGGMTHRRGPKVHVVIWKYPDERKTLATVSHEMTHAFLNRYRTPRTLPLWMEEGFAEYMSTVVTVDGPLEAERRSSGEQFIKTMKTMGPVNALLDMRCTHDGWPGPRNAGYAVGYLLLRHMFGQNAGGAVACINAIKDGKPWEHALAEDYGLGREALVKQLVSRHRKPLTKPNLKPTTTDSEPAAADAESTDGP